MKKNERFIRLVLVLFLITAVTALCLGAVNALTADRIADITNRRLADSLSEVLPADSYEPMELLGDRVSARYAAFADGVQIGYVARVTESGSQDSIDMLVGIDMNGAVTGVAIVDMAETPGLGDNAKKAQWREQFIGLRYPVAVTKDGGTVDALTGATVTSRAVAQGVNDALAAFDYLA